MRNSDVEVVERMRKLKHDNDLLKKERFKVKEVLRSKEMEIKSLKDENSKLLKRIELVENNLDDKILEVEKLVASNEKYINTNKSLRAEMKSLPNNLRKKAKRIQDLEASEGQYKKKISELEHVIIKLKETQRENTVFKENKKIKEYIRKLKLALSYRTISYYGNGLDELYQRVIYMRKHVDDYQSKLVGDVTVNKDEKGELVFGFLTSEHDKIVFVSVNGDVFSISASGIELAGSVDMPVEAMKVDESSVKIVRVLANDELYGDLTCKKNRKRNRGSLNRIADWEFNRKYVVLIIGSRNKGIYKEALRNPMLDVIWFDGFEESPSRLEGLCSKADVIIGLKRHMPHAVLPYLEEVRDKVTLLDNDTVHLVVAKVLQAVERLD